MTKEKQYVRAIYTGDDKDLGYRTGQTYTLEVVLVKADLETKVVHKRPYIQIRRAGKVKEGLCLYSSLQSFMRNWDIQGLVGPR